MENAMATALISEMATHARAASRALAGMSSPRKADAVLAMAQAIRRHAATILAANVTDLVRADQSGLSGAMRDRLALDTQRIEAMAAGIEAVASLRDPVGMIIDETIRPNGLHMARIRIPVGVIGIIYESRPNVTADTAALCVKSGNAVILSQPARQKKPFNASLPLTGQQLGPCWLRKDRSTSSSRAAAKG
jgi:glutamate-5-semialdehyde dehydrogenase